MSTNPPIPKFNNTAADSPSDCQRVFFEFVESKLKKRYPRGTIQTESGGIVIKEKKVWVIPEWKYIVDSVISTWETRQQILKSLKEREYDEVHLVYPRSQFFTKRCSMQIGSDEALRMKIIPISIESIRKHIPERYRF